MTTNIKVIAFLLILGASFLVPVPSMASVTATVVLPQSAVRIGEEVQFTIKVTSDGDEEIRTPKIPEIEGFTFTFNGSSQSTQISITQGQRSFTKTVNYTFTLIASKEGTYTLSGFGASTSAGDVLAQPIQIKVLSSDAPTPTPLPVANSYGLIFQADLNKTEAYVGEEILLTYTIYCPTARRLSQIQPPKDDMGRFKNFWTETVELGREYHQRVKASNGELYDKIPLVRYLLYPLTPGKQIISPISAVCQIPSGRNRGFFGFPFDDLVNVPVRTEEKTITVKPLPEEGKPDIFKGAVGLFQLKSSVESTTIEDGDTVTLKVTLEGKGNLKNAPDPVMPDLTSFDSYDPIKTPNIKKTVDGLSGSIEYTYVLVPHDQKANTIPPVRYAYFDPEKKTYVTLQTKPISLIIKPSTRRVISSTGGSMNRRTITMLGKDFRFNAMSLDALATVNLQVYKNVYFWILLISPLLLLIAALVWKRREIFLELNPNIAKSRKAPRLARKLLAQANKAIQEGNTETVYPQLSKAINDYISHRFNIASVGMTTLELRETLSREKIPEETIDRLIDTLEEYDGMRFSGTSQDTQSMKDDLSKAENLLASLMNYKSN